MRAPLGLLDAWIATTADDPAWWRERFASMAGAARRDFHLAFGLAPRRCGKADLALGEADRATAEAAVPGWRPQRWSVDQAARVALVLARAAALAEEAWLDELQECWTTAEIGEAVALGKGLAVFPCGARLEPRAREALRSNAAAQFAAVAHHNPYPAAHLDEEAWNQMVLKACFLGLPLDPIQGLDARANPALARMCYDFARERRAAGRPVAPELWRCVAPQAGEDARAELRRMLAGDDDAERRAAALALARCDPDALADRPDLAAACRSGALTWTTLTSA